MLLSENFLISSGKVSRLLQTFGCFALHGVDHINLKISQYSGQLMLVAYTNDKIFKD